MKRAGTENLSEQDIQKLRELEGYTPYTDDDFKASEQVKEALLSATFWIVVLFLIFVFAG